MPDAHGDFPSGCPPLSRAALLAELRQRVRRLEGGGGLREEGGMGFAVADLDAALPHGGLARGRVHELLTATSPGDSGADSDSGAATAFAAALLGRLASAGRPALWIVRGRDLHAPGLTAYGLTPDRLIVARADGDGQALWAMEEALRCQALAAVLGEVGAVDLTAGRRLQLAAEAGGTTGFLLRPAPRVERGAKRGAGRAREASAATTRWRIAAAPSAPTPGEPGVGRARWRVELLRCRGGRPGAWPLEWAAGRFIVADMVETEGRGWRLLRAEVA